MRTFRNIIKLSDSIAVVLLVVWLLNVLHPFAPYISDLAQHHIKSTTEHTLMHQMGINHVDNQISGIVQQQTEERGQNQEISLESPFLFFHEKDLLLFIPVQQDIGFMFMNFEHSNQFISLNFPPPKLSA